MAGTPYPHYPGWILPMTTDAAEEPAAEAVAEVDDIDVELFHALRDCQRLPCLQDAIALLRGRFTIGKR